MKRFDGFLDGGDFGAVVENEARQLLLGFGADPGVKGELGSVRLAFWTHGTIVPEKEATGMLRWVREHWQARGAGRVMHLARVLEDGTLRKGSLCGVRVTFWAVDSNCALGKGCSKCVKAAMDLGLRVPGIAVFVGDRRVV